MIKTIGFPISKKENENRRVIIPSDIKKLKYRGGLYFERGYGDLLGIRDEDYEACGCQVASRDEVLKQDIICDPKIGDADYLESLDGQVAFGRIHAVQNRDITDKLIRGKLTVYAREDMYEDGRHVFWRNNELAGEAAVFHAFASYGKMPYNCKVAVIGRGNTARGACKMLDKVGAEVVQYNRRMEGLLRKEISDFDVIINCVLRDVKRKDHLIYREDLAKMKKDSLIIDISCDENGAIETSRPTTIEEPTYTVNGVVHYVVDHTPSIFYKTFTYDNSKIIGKYLEELQEERPGKTLSDALIIENGKILDQRIIDFQNR